MKYKKLFDIYLKKIYFNNISFELFNQKNEIYNKLIKFFHNF